MGIHCDMLMKLLHALGIIWFLVSEVNGRRIEFLEGTDTPLKDTDTVLVFPVVAGG